MNTIAVNFKPVLHRGFKVKDHIYFECEHEDTETDTISLPAIVNHEADFAEAPVEVCVDCGAWSYGDGDWQSY